MRHKEKTERINKGRRFVADGTKCSEFAELVVGLRMRQRMSLAEFTFLLPPSLSLWDVEGSKCQIPVSLC